MPQRVEIREDSPSRSSGCCKWLPPLVMRKLSGILLLGLLVVGAFLLTTSRTTYRTSYSKLFRNGLASWVTWNATNPSESYFPAAVHERHTFAAYSTAQLQRRLLETAQKCDQIKSTKSAPGMDRISVPTPAGLVTPIHEQVHDLLVQSTPSDPKVLWANSAHVPRRLGEQLKVQSRFQQATTHQVPNGPDPIHN